MKLNITAGAELRRRAITRTTDHIHQVKSGWRGLRELGFGTFKSRDSYLAGERQRLERLQQLEMAAREVTQ